VISGIPDWEHNASRSANPWPQYHGWTGSILHGERSWRASNSGCLCWCDRHPPLFIVPRGRLSGKYKAPQKYVPEIRDALCVRRMGCPSAGFYSKTVLWISWSLVWEVYTKSYRRISLCRNPVLRNDI